MLSGSGATPANMRRIASALQAMGNHHRLMVLVELAQGERSVGELRRTVGLRPSALSQHLAKLRVGGLVRTRRDATRIYYSLSSPEVLTVLRGFGCLTSKVD
ncbi:helix-turn-helix transcriptional regulator [Magnetospirillum sp. J10]|uniref:Helix-turn-helix transcriptional regulator n=2 Tax=Magnetospirillum sulfuroxidans TaxID=611300 RepID=A0ABS5IEG3_9PROT|nr:helix-turn-helix transcriptional regulator [Magnetospirillum sulfuroxidans]